MHSMSINFSSEFVLYTLFNCFKNFTGSSLSSILRNTQFGESYSEELIHKKNVPQNNFLENM